VVFEVQLVTAEDELAVSKLDFSVIFKIPVDTKSLEDGQTLQVSKCGTCRSQWPRGLRRGSAAARLLRLWVQIPPGPRMFVVSVVCCQVEVSATS
jgi:hypothetical protein